MALRIEEDTSPEPFPMQQKDFFGFASEHDLSKHTARSAFLWVKAISTGRREARDVPQDLPPVTLIGDTGISAHTAIELHSLYAHLFQTFRTYGQTSASEQQESFLVALLNETLQPSELLVSKRLSRRR